MRQRRTAPERDRLVILAEIGKFVGAKVAGVIIAVATLVGGYWCWQNWDQVKEFGHGVKILLLWLLIVAALPWSSYLFMRPLIDYQARLQTAQGAGIVSVAVIAAFSLADILIAFGLSDDGFSGSFTWFVVLLGFAAAAAYNFVICESLARQAES